jgi:hypothetical protein
MYGRQHGFGIFCKYSFNLMMQTDGFAAVLFSSYGVLKGWL